MKIAILNINGVNKRLPNLMAWLAAARPDIVCLQEFKTAQEAFPIDAVRAAGYGAVRRGERAWNGVATVGRATPGCGSITCC